jgi:hypothetical protein
MLVIVGVNQSSINVLDPDSHSTSIRGIYTWENSIGPKQFIRSDEFLRSSPSIIGAMTTGINNSSTLLSEESDVVFGIPNSGFDFFFFPEKIISFLFLPKISILSHSDYFVLFSLKCLVVIYSDSNFGQLSSRVEFSSKICSQ